MEFYLVKDSVTVAELKEGYQRTTELDDFISVYGGEWIDPEDEHDKLSLEDFAVDLNSFQYEKQMDDEQGFGGEVNRRLRHEEQIFADLKVELLISTWREEFEDQYGELNKCHHGYLLLSGMEQSADSEEESVNIIERLEHAFGENEIHFDIELDLGHLPTKDAGVSLDSLTTLKATNLKYCSLPQRIGGRIERLPTSLDNLWRRHEAGFIRGKLTVKVRVDKDAANYFLKFRSRNSPKGLVGLNRKLLKGGIFKDLEIGCNNGAVVKCHSVFLAANSKRLEDELKAQTERPLILEMKMEEKGVKGFLEWIYCKQVSKAAGEKCEGALELLKVAMKYKVDELETEMEKLLMSKGAKDLRYFSVDAALKLYLYTKDESGLGELKSKAVRVLKNYTKEAGDKLNESVCYQRFFRKEPHEAMKLSHLYGRLS